MENTSADGGTYSHNIFDVNQAFFAISPENCADVETRLYGWCIAGGQIITETSQLAGKELTPDGCYVYVERDGGTITIRQDYLGCYGLYLYRSKDAGADTGGWVLSNSFLYLEEQVRRTHPVTFNKQYADCLLCCGLVPLTCSETMIRQITCLDRSAVIRIDVSSGLLTMEPVDYGENTVALDSEEGMALLDQWYAKWTSLIRNLKRATDNIKVDLSGGFDSRETFSLFVGSGMDLNEIQVHSAADKLHTHREDYEIAEEIADHYGFSLNRPLPHTGSENYSLEDILNISFYTKLTFHNQMYWARSHRKDYQFHFTGGGGECIRTYWEKKAKGSLDLFIHRKALRSIMYWKDAPAISQSIEKSLRRSFDEIREKYKFFRRELSVDDMITALYRETRCRVHFGKARLENYFAGTIMFSPLLDEKLQRLKLCTKDCEDRDLLAALILARYNDGLLGFRYEGGRSFSEETVRYARKLCGRFPVRLPGEEVTGTLILPVNHSLTDPDRHLQNTSVKKEELRRVVMDAFCAPEVRETFEMLYKKSTLRRIGKGFANAYFPESNAYPVISIARILQDCVVNRSL